MEIVIIKLGAIGDVVRTTSILPALKEKYKNAKISWVTKNASSDLLENNKYVSNLHTIEKLNIDNLAKKKFDMVVSLDEDKEACNIASKLKKEKLIGSYAKEGKLVYTDDSSLWFDMGLISKFGKKKANELKAKNEKTYPEIIFSILGLKNYKEYPPYINIPKKYIKFADSFAKKISISKNNIENNVIVGINTGAGGRWRDKKLSVEETSKLIDKLNNEIKNVKILLFGGPEEKERNQKIKNLAKTKIIDAECDNHLMAFAALVNLCHILVTSDSLAMHMGIALKKKIVCFFAPTSPSEIELYSRGIKILPKKGCVCCYKPKCDIPPKWDIAEFVRAVKRLL